MNASSAAVLTSSRDSESPRYYMPEKTVAPAYGDEIDLLELIKSILKTWKVWLLVVVVTTTVFGYFQIIAYLSASAKASYSKHITLNFKGADKGQYPSGAAFRIQDIIAPAVLQAVYANLSLDTAGLNMAEFQNRITIEPYTPFYREINEKYNSLLTGDKQSYEQIQVIQESKQRELNQALSSNATLAFNPGGTKISLLQVEEILRAIPEEWARQAIADKGVLKTDIQLISSRTLNEKLFNNVDYIVLSDLFADKIAGLRDNIDKVKALEGSATVNDPETGWSLSDLENNLYDLETYTIDELMSPIRSLGLSRNPKLAAFYYDEKKEVMQEELAKLQDESSLIKSAFDSYSPQNISQPTAGRLDPALAGGMPLVPQVSGDLLDKLLQTAGEDSVEKYRQVLNDHWLKTNMEVAEVKSKIRNIDRLIAAVKGQQSDELTSQLRDEYLTRAEEQLPAIVDQLRGYYDINWRIYEQISGNRVGSVGYLYKDGHQGVIKTGIGMSLKRILMVYIALIAGVTFIVVPLVMVRNALKARKYTEAHPPSEA